MRERDWKDAERRGEEPAYSTRVGRGEFGRDSPKSLEDSRTPTTNQQLSPLQKELAPYPSLIQEIDIALRRELPLLAKLSNKYDSTHRLSVSPDVTEWARRRAIDHSSELRSAIDSLTKKTSEFQRLEKRLEGWLRQHRLPPSMNEANPDFYDILARARDTPKDELYSIKAELIVSDSALNLDPMDIALLEKFNPEGSWLRRILRPVLKRMGRA